MPVARGRRPEIGIDYSALALARTLALSLSLSLCEHVEIRGSFPSYCFRPFQGLTLQPGGSRKFAHHARAREGGADHDAQVQGH